MKPALAAAALLALAASASAQETRPSQAVDPVDRARAANRDRALPKAAPEEVGTPPIITKKSSSVPGTSSSVKARDKGADHRH